MSEEIPRIRKLRASKQLDNYMLFSNRRLAGNAESTIRAHISKECDIAELSIYLCGTEQLELWMKTFPVVARLAPLDPIDSPLIVSPDELAEVVLALAGHTPTVLTALDDPPAPRVTYADKNALNNMTAEYAAAQQRRYLKETAQIRSFLAAPENLSLLQLYETVIDEIELKVVANRQSYQTFDKVMEYLADLLFKRDPILRTHKRLTRVMLFYMYWNCDIGKVEDAATN